MNINLEKETMKTEIMLERKGSLENLLRKKISYFGKGSEILKMYFFRSSDISYVYRNYLEPGMYCS